MVLKVVASYNSLTYLGTWNAATNTPTLVSGIGPTNGYYIVSVAGNTNLDGITNWNVGDWAIFNGSTWERVAGGDAETFSSITVTSLTGYMFANGSSPVTASTTIPVANVTGAVANTTYILAGTGLSGGGNLTANVTLNNAGVLAFNTRTGNVTLTSSDVTTALGYTPGTGNGTVTSVSGTAPISSTGGNTPTLSITQAGTSTNGYLSSTDWNTFKNKGSGNGTVTSVATGTGLTGGPITSTGTISISNTTVTASSYGLANSVSKFTVNAQGQLTNASNTLISITNGQVSGLGTMSTQNSNSVTITGGTINIQTTSLNASTSSSATFATSSLPLVPAGYVNFDLNGTVVKIPYYAV